MNRNHDMMLDQEKIMWMTLTVVVSTICMLDNCKAQTDEDEGEEQARLPCMKSGRTSVSCQ
jgi:hypothetical protein